MKRKEGVIEQIYVKNTISIFSLDIKYIGWLSKPTLGKKKSSLFIECKTTTQANGTIKEGLAIGVELYQYTLYNLAYK